MENEKDNQLKLKDNFDPPTNIKELFFKNMDRIIIIVLLILMFIMYQVHTGEIQACIDFYTPLIEQTENPFNLSWGFGGN